MDTPAAVLTGDLIGSSAAGPKATGAAMDHLAAVAEEIALWPGGTPTRFTRYRGDGWQMLVAPPGRGLRAALILAASLRATAHLPLTRIALGFGQIGSGGGSDLSDAHGAAFTAAGAALDAIGRHDRLAAAGAGMSPLHLAMLALMDDRCQRWSPEQAEAMVLALFPAPPTQAAMAKALGISTSAVNYRLIGAGIRPVRRALEAWEAGQ